MRSISSNLLAELVPSAFFSAVVSLLFTPWLYLIMKNASSHEITDFLPLWSVLVVLLSIIYGKWLAKFDARNRYLALVLYLVAHSLPLYFLGWPLAVFIPFVLVFLLFGLRFRLYYTVADVRADIGLALLFFFFNLTLNNELSLSVGMLDVLVFFIAVSCLALFFNLRSLQEEGFQPRYSFSFSVLGISSGGIFLAAFLIGIPLEGGLVRAVLDVVHKIYLYFVDVIMVVVYALIWLLRPLFNLIENLELTRPEMVTEGESQIGSVQDFVKGVEGSEAAGGAIVQYILWGSLCLVLSFLAVRLVRKLSRGSDGGLGEKGVVQESESIFSISELNSRFKDRWATLAESLAGYGNKVEYRYRGEDPLTRIRRIYFNFALKLKDATPFRTSDTPRGYQDRLYRNIGQKKLGPETEELTEIYNQARYGNHASTEDADRARNLWEHILGRLKEK